MPDKKGVWSTERLLGVEEWSSRYRSIQKVLNHLARKTKSESSRQLFCEVLAAFCKFYEIEPDSLLGKNKGEIEDMVHTFLDSSSARSNADIA